MLYDDGMKAEVTLDGQVAPDFEVSNGLCQGCVMHLLFSTSILV